MDEHVKFVKYTGKYPALCFGTLILNIDGKEVSFGSLEGDYLGFWTSGGCVHVPYGDNGEEESVEEGPWIIDEDEIPEQYRKYSKEIVEIFNDNVPWGCCGGCI